MASTVTSLESPEVLQRGTVVEFSVTRMLFQVGTATVLVLGGMMLFMEHGLAHVPLECWRISTVWTSRHYSGTLIPLSPQCWVRNLTGQFSCVYSATLTFPSEKHCHDNKRNYLSSHLRRVSSQVCFALMFGLGRCKGVVSDFIPAGLFLLFCFRVPVVFRRAFPAGIRWHLPRLPPSYHCHSCCNPSSVRR